MKVFTKYLGIMAFVLMTTVAFSQTPPPPNNGTTGSGGTTPVGGGAPVGSGLIILTAMATAYGYAKWENQVPDYQIKE